MYAAGPAEGDVAQITIMGAEAYALNFAKDQARKTGKPYAVYKLVQTHHVKASVAVTTLAPVPGFQG